MTLQLLRRAPLATTNRFSHMPSSTGTPVLRAKQPPRLPVPSPEVKPSTVNPNSASKSELTKRIVPVTPAEYYQLLPKLSPMQVRGILMSGMQGNLSYYYDLVSLMQDTWPRLAKNLHEICDAVSRVRFKYYPYRENDDTEPTASAKEKADFMNRAIQSFEPNAFSDEKGFRDTVYGFCGAMVMPTMHEVLFPLNGSALALNHNGEIVPKATAWVQSRRLCITPTGEFGLVGHDAALEFPNRPASIYGAGGASRTLQGKFIMSVYQTRNGAATMSGLLRPLAWWWAGMMFSRDWLLQYAEKFSRPIPIAKYALGITPEDFAKLEAFLKGFGDNAYLALPEGTLMEWAEFKGVDRENPQRVMIELADEFADLMILGQTMTSSTPKSGASGTMSQGEVGERIRRERVESVANWVARSPLRQLARILLQLNYNTTDECPRCEPDWSAPIGAQDQANVLQTLKNIGWEIANEEEMRKLVNLPVVKAATPEPAAPGLGGRPPSPADGGEGAGQDKEKKDDKTETPDEEVPRTGAAGGKLRVLRAGDADPMTKLAANARAQLVEAKAKVNGIVARRLSVILAIGDDETMLAELRHLQNDLPKILTEMNADDTLRRILEESMSAAMLNGMADSAKQMTRGKS